MLPRITPPRVLARMNKRALRPVMRISPRTRFHLKHIHPKLIGTINTLVNIR
ncbi:hypothetical protein HanIR_Chr14g0723391 [Helianthus annuus]|nr:hypothetical protein HanIR_Chr14g0723391 [Helianthus annuus]